VFKKHKINNKGPEGVEGGDCVPKKHKTNNKGPKGVEGGDQVFKKQKTNKIDRRGLKEWIRCLRNIE